MSDAVGASSTGWFDFFIAQFFGRCGPAGNDIVKKFLDTDQNDSDDSGADYEYVKLMGTISNDS